MKHILLLILSGCIYFSSIAQSEAEKLVNQGIALHDQGDYEAAIAKYDAALQLDPANYLAMYEKSFAYMAMKKYDESMELLKKVLKECKAPEIRKLSYTNYGTILDHLGEGKKSIKVYDDGIKEFPDHYLLHFNKGVTLSGMRDVEGSLESFKNSLRCNPYHASSHNAVARITGSTNRIPAILSLFSFLLVEPTGKRAEQNLDLMNKLIMKGVSQDGKNITISLDPSMLGDKKKKKDDDFSSAELILSLTAASNSIPDTLGAKTDADRLSYRLQMITNVIGEVKDNDKGFFKNFYVPFFAEMKKKDMMTTACYIAMSSSGKEDITKWLEDNPLKQELFYDWFKKYAWPKE